MAASFAFMLIADLPAHGQERTACSERPISREYWSWREIEGRRCWFVGRATMPKSMLYWRQPDARAPTPRVADSVRIDDRARAVRSDNGAQPVTEPKPMRAAVDLFPRVWRFLMETFTPRSLLDPTPISEWR
jgi:hypothetical protein